MIRPFKPRTLGRLRRLIRPISSRLIASRLISGSVEARVHRPALVAIQAILVAVLALGSMGAADTAVRYNELGHQMMCVCSCAQILIECNHVGCPDSDGMLRMLKVSIARGDGDRTILEAFQAKYGATVLAAPMLTRFNTVAWVVPPAVLAIGLIGAIALIRRWRLANALAGSIPDLRIPDSPRQQAARARIRQETEL